MKKIIMIFVILLLIAAVSADMSNKFINPTLYSPSIIDLNKITMNHTISFTGGISSNQQSIYQSLYTNHINYQISSKLNFRLDLNFVNYGSASFDQKFRFEGNGDNQSTILPEFSLTYKPSENFNIIFEYRNVSLSNHWYDSRPWYRD